MANLWLKNLLGQIPATEKLEASRNQLFEERKKYEEIDKSEQLARYYELKKYIESDEFQNKKHEIESIRYEGSKEATLIEELKNLQKDKSIQNYFRVLESEKLKRFRNIEQSSQLARFEELKETVESGQIDDIKKQMDADHKAEIDKNKRYKTLQKDAAIKKYFKLINSADYENYKKINNSELLQEYNDLKNIVEAFDYNQINKENQEEFKKQLKQRERYNTLKKDPGIKSYLKFVAAKYPELIENTAKGKLLKELETLKAYIESTEYQQNLKNTDFKESDLYQLEQEYKKLQKDPDIKFYYKFKASKAYLNYLEIKDSDKLKRYYELKKQTEDPEFQKQVEYLKDNKKFEKTEEYKSLEELNELKNNENIKWYFKVQQEDRFRPLREWKVIFEEEFDNNTWNEDIWSPVKFPGLISFNDNYSIKGEKQCFTKGDNLRIDASALHIQVLQKNSHGKTWHPKQGFMNEQFNFTSGTLNTAKAFRFNQGQIEIKAKVQQPQDIVHGVSLKGEKIVPHIDLLKTGKGHGYAVRYIKDTDNQNITSHQVKGVNINDKYYIHRLEWTSDELIWHLNDIEVAREQHQLNGEELYISLASILEKTPENLPAELAIDWIKVYKKQEVA